MSAPDPNSNHPPPGATATASPADLVSTTELHLGRALALIHRVLPRLEEVERADAVLAALQQAATEVATAAAHHERTMASRRPAPLEGELLALIAAAVAVVIGRPHRVLSIEKAVPVVTWVNAWAIEGRFQHYSSHKVR